jgi:hypothetical protein
LLWPHITDENLRAALTAHWDLIERIWPPGEPFFRKDITDLERQEWQETYDRCMELGKAR